MIFGFFFRPRTEDEEPGTAGKKKHPHLIVVFDQSRPVNGVLYAGDHPRDARGGEERHEQRLVRRRLVLLVDEQKTTYLKHRL